MPYMVPSMANIPVGVVLSPSCLLSLKPASPTRAEIGGKAGVHTPAFFVNASRVAVVDPYAGACTTTTWLLVAGSVRSRVARFGTGFGGALVVAFAAGLAGAGEARDADAVGEGDG